MSKWNAGQKRAKASGEDQQAAPLPAAPDNAPDDATAPDSGIPAHVWDMLQKAGEEAARALLDLLQSPRFKTFKPSEQRGLIDLAFTRAYGLPVRRSVSVELSSSDADAVAQSLLALQESLPERRARTGEGSPTVEHETPVSEPL